MPPIIKVLARVCLSLWLIVLAAPVAAEGDYGSLYRQALEARERGDFGAATTAAEGALDLRPESVEALLLLGSLQAYRERYVVALETLSKARALAPDNLDLRLAIARTQSWRGDHGAARAELAAVLEADPGNLEARLLEARLAYYRQDAEAAERALGLVLDSEPENTEALLLLGDVKRAAGDGPGARRLYERVAVLAPETPGIEARLEQPEQKPWRADIGYNLSRFSREERSDWKEGFFQLNRDLGSRSGVFGRLESKERFDLWDLHLAAGGSHRFTDWLSAHVSAGLTPNADFLARWVAGGGGAARLWTGWEDIGATVLTLVYLRSDFASGVVDTISPGLEQYLLSGRVRLTGRWINTLNEDNDWTRGWLARLDWQPLEALGLYAGLADAPETVAGRTVDTRSTFAGIVYQLSSERSVRFDYARDDREDSYIRDSFAVSVSQRF